MGSRNVERTNRGDNKEFFEKCRIIKNDDLMEIEEEDLEFKALVQELCPDVSATEYLNIDDDIPASEPLINEHEIDWRQKSREDCINVVLNESNIAQKNSDDDNDDDEDVAEIEDDTLSFTELLKMLEFANTKQKAKVNNIIFQLISIN